MASTSLKVASGARLMIRSAPLVPPETLAIPARAPLTSNWSPLTPLSRETVITPPPKVLSSSTPVVAGSTSAILGSPESRYSSAVPAAAELSSEVMISAAVSVAVGASFTALMTTSIVTLLAATSASRSLAVGSSAVLYVSGEAELVVKARAVGPPLNSSVSAP